MANFTTTALAMCREAETITTRQAALLGQLSRVARSPTARTVRVLAGALNVEPSIISKTADGLISAGWVERVVDVNDRRGTTIGLTDDGAAYVKRLNSGWSEAA